MHCDCHPQFHPKHKHLPFSYLMHSRAAIRSPCCQFMGRFGASRGIRTRSLTTDCWGSVSLYNLARPLISVSYLSSLYSEGHQCLFLSPDSLITTTVRGPAIAQYSTTFQAHKYSCRKDSFPSCASGAHYGGERHLCSLCYCYGSLMFN